MRTWPLALILVLAACGDNVVAAPAGLDPPVLSFALSAASYADAVVAYDPTRATPAGPSGMRMSIPLREDDILHSITLSCIGGTSDLVRATVTQTTLGTDVVLADAQDVVGPYWKHYEFAASPLLVLPHGDALALRVRTSSPNTECGNVAVRYQALGGI